MIDVKLEKITCQLEDIKVLLANKPTTSEVDKCMARFGLFLIIVYAISAVISAYFAFR